MPWSPQVQGCDFYNPSPPKSCGLGYLLPTSVFNPHYLRSNFYPYQTPSPQGRTVGWLIVFHTHAHTLSSNLTGVRGMQSGKEYTGWGLQEDWKERQWTLDRAKNALYLFMELLKNKIFESSSLFCDVYA